VGEIGKKGEMGPKGKEGNFQEGSSRVTPERQGGKNANTSVY